MVYVEDKVKKRDSSSSQRSKHRSRSRSKEKDKKFVPTNEAQLKFVILKYMESENFLYPVPIEDAYNDIRLQYKEIKGAYHFLGSLNYEKVVDDIANSSGVVLEEVSKGIRLSKFITRTDIDKIQQLARESYKDRPKTEVDLELIGNESYYEEALRKKNEEEKKANEERIRKCKRLFIKY